METPSNCQKLACWLNSFMEGEELENINCSIHKCLQDGVNPSPVSLGFQLFACTAVKTLSYVSGGLLS